MEYILLAQAVGIPVGRHSGSQLATTLVATIDVIIFFPFVANLSYNFNYNIVESWDWNYSPILQPTTHPPTQPQK